MADGHYNDGDGSNNDNGNGSNGWTRYGKLVLSELERLQGDIDKIDERETDTRENLIPSMNDKITALRVQAGFIGAIAGAIFSAIMYAVLSHVVH